LIIEACNGWNEWMETVERNKRLNNRWKWNMWLIILK
jgi:hypothetical protein